MKDINLITEGDINISVSREQWNKSIESEETLKWLERDAESFYHQS